MSPAGPSRQAVAAASVIEQYGETRASADFAGVHFDRTGTLHAAFVREIPRHRADLAFLGVAVGEITFEARDNTVLELRSIVHRISTSDRGRLRAAGAVVSSVGEDIAANRVKVTLESDGGQSMFDRMYGPGRITVVSGRRAVSTIKQM